MSAFTLYKTKGKRYQFPSFTSQSFGLGGIQTLERPQFTSGTRAMLAVNADPCRIFLSLSWRSTTI